MSKHFEDMTLAELETEREHWESEIAGATEWGAGLAAADGFRLSCIAWIARRKIEAAATSERSQDNVDAAFRYVEGEVQTLPQPSEAATELALTATPQDFPRDSYGLAQWIDRAFAVAMTTQQATTMQGEV